MDANNTIWQDDLRLYERARQQEIRQTADACAACGDVEMLEAACRDLQDPRWLESPPKDLVQSITGTYKRVVKKRAQAEMEEIEPKLNDAFGQFAVDQARALRARWNACTALAELQDECELVERVTPALEWLDEQDRMAGDEAAYHDAINSLDQALDDEASASVLERLGHAALRFEAPLAAFVGAALSNSPGNAGARSRSAHSADCRQALAAMLLVGAVVGWLIYHHQQEEDIAAHVHVLQGLLDKKMFDEAHAALRRVN